MKRRRRERFPPSPRNLQEFVDQVSDPARARILEYESGRLSIQLIMDNDGAQHVLFHDQNFVNTAMADVSKLLIDATFATRPRLEGVYQLLTVMGIKFSHVRHFIYYKLLYLAGLYQKSKILSKY